METQERKLFINRAWAVIVYTLAIYLLAVSGFALCHGLNHTGPQKGFALVALSALCFPLGLFCAGLATSFAGNAREARRVLRIERDKARALDELDWQYPQFEFYKGPIGRDLVGSGNPSLPKFNKMTPPPVKAKPSGTKRE